MKELIRPAGEALFNFLKTEEGRKAGMTALQKGAEGLGKARAMTGRAAEEAVLTGAPMAAKFASKFADKQGLVGKAASKVAGLGTDQIIDAAVTAGKIGASPITQTVGLIGTGALVGGALTKPETAYTAAMDTIAAREASAYGIIDAKLQADAARQLGNQELAAQKFQQSLFLQEQRQQHDMMIAQARAEARTPRNQPMSGAGLFDPMAIGQQIYGGTPQY